MLLLALSRHVVVKTDTWRNVVHASVTTVMSFLLKLG